MAPVGGQSRPGGAVLVTPGGQVVGSADTAGQKSRNRRSRNSSSRRRAAEARAKAEQLKRIEEEQQRKEASLRLQEKIEATAKTRQKIGAESFKSQVEKVQTKIQKIKKFNLFRDAFKVGISKQRKFLTRAERDIRLGIKPTQTGEKVARRYVAVSKITNKIIKTNPKILNILVNQQKLTDRSIKELRLAGLGVAQTFVDFVEFSPEVIKFLTVNNPAWNKKNRNTISDAITTYTPKVWNWGKEIATDSEKRRIAGIAAAAFAANQLKIVKVSPGRSLGRIGGQWILFVVSGGTWKAAKVIDRRATKGLLKVGNRWVRGNDVLNLISKKGIQTVKKIGSTADDIIIKTTGKIKRTRKRISNIKILKEVKKEVKKQEKNAGRKLSLTEKRDIAKIIRSRFRKIKFTKIERNAFRRELDRMESKIKGIKVTKKEFNSFVAAQKEFNKLKNLKKFANKIESKGGAGVTQRVSKSAISTSERDLLNSFKQLPSNLKFKADKLSFTTFSQKFVTDVPILKRIGGVKNGVWRIFFKQKTFYQNTVSISMFNKVGKALGTFSYNTIANKPIQRFRSIASALKWGRGKTVSISRQFGKDFIKTIVLKSRRGKVSQSEFLSKVKLVRKGIITDVDIVTITASGSPVSRTAARIIKTTQRGKTKFKRGVLKIIDTPKVIEKIKAASIIDPVVIDTSRIDAIVRILNKIKDKGLKVSQKKRKNAAEKRIRRALQKGRFRFKGKPKVVISKQKLIQIEKVAKELQRTTAFKQSLAAASIPKRIRIPKRIEGLTDLKKLARVEKTLKKVRLSKNISKGEKLIFASLILSLNKAKAKSRILSKASSQSQKNKLVESLVSISSSLSKKSNRLSTKTAKMAVMKITKTLPLAFARIRIPQGEATKKPKMFRLKKKRRFEFRTLKNSVPTFKVVAKRRGRKVTLLTLLTAADAKNFLAFELDNQLLRTGQLVPTGKRKRVVKLTSEYSGYFNKNKRKLRAFKIKKGQKKKISGYIERKKFVGDTRGEIIQLQIARRRKRK